MQNNSNNYVQVHTQTIIAFADLQSFWRRKKKNREKKVSNSLGLKICISFFSSAILTYFANFLCGEGGFWWDLMN